MCAITPDELCNAHTLQVRSANSTIVDAAIVLADVAAPLCALSVACFYSEYRAECSK